MNGLNPQQIQEIQAELRNGRKIAAVKRYKDWMRCSLLEAKNAVEAIQRDPASVQTSEPSRQQIDSQALDQAMQSVDQAIAQGKLIDAIKQYRELSGKSLMESKTFIESRMKRLASEAAVAGKPSASQGAAPDGSVLKRSIPDASALQSKRSGCFSVLLLGVSLVTSFLVVVAAVTGAAADPCSSAHAHNDYLHDRPLLDALDQGFCSVEADIYLIDGKLLVAHDLDKTNPSRTLQSLYLDPLRNHVKQRSDSSAPDGAKAARITLLIDIKSEGSSTYRALDNVLQHYRDLLVHVDENGFHSGAVVVIISGNRDFEAIASDPTRYAGIDGRLTDLDSTMKPDLLPLISDHWGRHFKWRGEGEMPNSDREKLKQIVTQVHASGRRVRFWATPDLPAVWSALADADVDLINTDDLPGLSRFLRERN